MSLVVNSCKSTAYILSTGSDWVMNVQSLFIIDFPDHFDKTLSLFQFIEEDDSTTQKQATIYSAQEKVYYIRTDRNGRITCAATGNNSWLTNSFPLLPSLGFSKLTGYVERTEVILENRTCRIGSWRGKVVRCSNGNTILVIPRSGCMLQHGTVPLFFAPGTVSSLPPLQYIRWSDGNRFRFTYNTFNRWPQTNSTGRIIPPDHASFVLLPPAVVSLRVRRSHIIIGFGCAVIGLIFLFRGLAIWRRNERDFSRNQRLIAVGELAAGVAHEVRNPLNAVSLTMQNLLSNSTFITAFPNYLSMLKMAGEEILRVNNILTDFLHYSRPARLERRKSSLNDLCNNVAFIMKAAADRQNIEINSQLDQTTELTIDHEQIHQALINVTMNAIEAMPDGGTLSFITRQYKHTTELEIADSGCGIPPDKRDNVFDLYYTTKHKGVGLGLPYAYRVVSLHGGRIRIEDAIPHGTRILLIFPVKQNIFGGTTDEH